MNKNTWSKKNKYSKAMFNRIEKLLNMIDISNMNSIMDVGCGNQQSRELILSKNKNIEYIPVDAIQHILSTIKKDFNKKEFLNQTVDVCLCSGIFEYIYMKNIKAFIKNICNNCDTVIGSYHFKENYKKRSDRNKKMVNDMEFIKFSKFFYKNGFVLESYKHSYKNENLFVFVKNNKRKK